MKNTTIVLGISAIILIVIFGGLYFFYNSSSFFIKEHTCYFNKDSLDITCSPELRIRIGHKELPLELKFSGDNRVKSCTSTKCYSEEGVYSETNSVNLQDISFYGFAPVKDPKDFYESRYQFRNRVIEVKDVNSNEIFTFFVDQSGDYYVEETNGEVDYGKYLCMSQEGGNLCVGQHWRCGQGLDYIDGCDLVVQKISDGTASLSDCYDLKYPSLVSYCLGRAETLLGKKDLEKCLEYAEQEPSIISMCKVFKCDQIPHVEKKANTTLGEECTEAKLAVSKL